MVHVSIEGQFVFQDILSWGTESGVLFVPSHLVEEVINSAEKTHAKDIFGFDMLEQGIYTTAAIDNSVWNLEMMERLIEFVETDERCEKYRVLIGCLN